MTETKTPGERVAQWLTNIRTVIVLYTMLGFGTLYGVNDNVRGYVNNLLPIAEGETVVPQQIPPEIRQSLESFDAAIKALRKDLKALEIEKTHDDITQNSRLDDIEAVVQR